MRGEEWAAARSCREPGASERSGFYFKNVKKLLKCVKQKSDMMIEILQGQLLLCGACTRQEQEWKPGDQLGGCYTLCVPGTKAEKRGRQIQ